MQPVKTADLRGIQYQGAMAAFSYAYGYTRIVRFRCGLQGIEHGTFLFGRMAEVDSLSAIGPVDDFGCIHNLSDESLDAFDISIAD